MFQRWPRWLRRYALVILVLATLGAVQWLAGFRTGGWESTVGVITASELRPMETAFGDGRFLLSVRYGFEVGGQRFEGRRITPGGLLGSAFEAAREPGSDMSFLQRWRWRLLPLPAAERAEDLLPWSALYPVGRRVTVFFDPDDPTRAVLTRESTNPWLHAAGVLAILVVVSLPFVLVISWFRRAARAGRPRTAGRGTILTGIAGIGLVVLAAWRGETAARTPPPPLTPEAACVTESAAVGGHYRLAELPPPSADDLRSTGLRKPAFAACAQAEALQSPLPGCVFETSWVDPVAPLPGMGTIAAPPDDPGSSLVALDAGGLVVLSRRTDFAPGPVGHAFRGRVIHRDDLAAARPELEVVARQLPAELVLLADRAMLVPVRERLSRFGDCAVVSIPDGLAGDAVVRWTPNRLELGGDLSQVTRPAHLRAMSWVDYRRAARAGWDLLLQVGMLLVAASLLPAVLRWSGRHFGRS